MHSARISDALKQAHQELGGRTRTALARVTAAAAEQAVTQPPPPVLSTSHLRELAAAASRVFGWDGSAKTQGDTYQTLVITQEQLEQIRQLRELDVYEAPRLEGPPQPFPASSGYEVKVTP